MRGVDWRTGRNRGSSSVGVPHLYLPIHLTCVLLCGVLVLLLVSFGRSSEHSSRRTRSG